MASARKVIKDPFSFDALNKAFAGKLRKMTTTTEAFWFRCSDGPQCRFELFEGFRHPERQHYLLTVSKTTKARPWQSAHQYGLAADFAVAVYEDGEFTRWSWAENAPWPRLKVEALTVGLDIPIRWDFGHVEDPVFRLVKAQLLEAGLS